MMELFQEFRKERVLDSVPAGPVAVGVSGGADSVALLHLLWRLRRERGWKIAAVHAQHRLRGEESARDQKFVEDLCGRLKVECRVCACPVTQRTGIEEAARILRYGAFSRVARALGAKTIVTAHNADDQAETFFLNLIRGAGPKGLCAIWPLRPLSDVTLKARDKNVDLVRPLLSFSREEILRYLKSQRLDFVEDSSNLNLEFKRNWVRHKLLPLLKEAQPKIQNKVSYLSYLLQKSSEAQDLELGKMQKKVFLADGRWLDVEAFFRYHRILRTLFLTKLFPHSSSKGIEAKMATLEKERRLKRYLVLMAKLIQ